MATSSFTKDFTLRSKRAVDSFTRILDEPYTGVKLVRPAFMNESRPDREVKLKKMLARRGELLSK